MSGHTAPQSTPQEEVEAAILAGSIPQLSAALERAAEHLDMETSIKLLDSALEESVRQGNTTLVKYLLDEGANIAALDVLDVALKPSVALWEILKSHKYDFNKAGPPNSIFKGRSPIYKVTHDVELVQWLIEQCGVSLDMGEEDYWHEPRPPLLLQACASLGSVASFKIIKERGAKIGRRTLHVAVSEAAVYGCDPDSACLDTKAVSEERATRGLSDLSDQEHKRNREDMLRYLVDELHLDVNGLDSDDQTKPSSRGTPLKYAERADEGAAVVRWLLKKGAHPDAVSSHESKTG